MISKLNNYLLYFKIFSKQLYFIQRAFSNPNINRMYCNLLYFVPHTENICFC